MVAVATVTKTRPARNIVVDLLGIWLRRSRALLLGYVGAFRRSELVALEVDDLRLSAAGRTSAPETPGPRGATTRESNLTEMAEDDQLQRIFSLLDVLSVQVSATQAGVDSLREETRSGVGALREETRNGFERVERRLGNLETRVEGIETDLRAFRNETNRRVSSLEERSH